MNYSVKSIEVFERQAKYLVKRFPSLKGELRALIKDLKGNPIQGTSLGHHCYKIRLAIKSKNKGKSGGARVIINTVLQEENVYLLSIYDKSDKANISQPEIRQLLQYIPK